jgi:hypothetical protein
MSKKVHENKAEFDKDKDAKDILAQAFNNYDDREDL